MRAVKPLPVLSDMMLLNMGKVSTSNKIFVFSNQCFGVTEKRFVVCRDIVMTVFSHQALRSQDKQQLRHVDAE